ncbi:Caleosin related protein-domain-containing protein [Kalaharituber pfeilii]|nr:Caleosin related protein-domain-containing protein [Kalaharituber pfeilii]
MEHHGIVPHLPPSSTGPADLPSPTIVGEHDYTHNEIITGISTSPVTQQRKPYIPSEHGHGLKNLGVPRANIAASVENPYGTTKDNYSTSHRHQTVLQQHCAFFDRDNDGILWPYDTYVGFRRVGFGIFLAVFSMFIIHVTFSYPTVHGILPDPYFRIWLDNIHNTKHGSDTGTYDGEGRFIPQNFEDIFEKYSNYGQNYGETKKGLTFYDILRGWNSQRNLVDPIGWGGEMLEWLATYILLWPEDGIMRKEDIRRVYDGSIFWDIAEKRENQRMEQLGMKQRSSRMIKLNMEKDAEFSQGQKSFALEYGSYLRDGK